MKIGIIREGKTPPDKRVPLTPAQCHEIVEKYPEVEIYVQPSEIRAIPDSAYEAEGLPLREDLSNCDLIIGVKEVPIDMLIPNKRYMFFSHTYKKQPYNRKLLKAIVDKKISLIDYEVLTRDNGSRLIGFGRYAGIVGCYNALLAAGKKNGWYDLKPAHKCEDRKEVERELAKVKLPANYKIALTGGGRVGKGAMEILDYINMPKVSPADYLNKSYDHAVYTQLEVLDYNKKKDGTDATKTEFYNSPELFESDFTRFTPVSDMYIACHYWDHRSPFIFTREDAKSPMFKINIVADISCDIDGPVASTLRPSTIADPLYGYKPSTESEVDFMDPDAIGVMAVDNLPCELPMDASEDFGSELVKHVIPEFLKEDSDILRRATETSLEGGLTEEYRYLEGYLRGED